MMTGETILSGGAKSEHLSPFKVMKSGAGWYVGTTWTTCLDPSCLEPECGMMQQDGKSRRMEQPGTRETGYFATPEEAQDAVPVYLGDGFTLRAPVLLYSETYGERGRWP